jgi:hypothetical protein
MRAAWIVVIAGCGFESQAGTAGTIDAAPTAPDAASPDAPASLQCPASYNVTALPGPTRYRLIQDGHRAWEQSDACNKDQPGATHLVVIETLMEFNDVSAYIRPGLGTAGDSVWIGAVQLVTATSPGDAWLGFDGKPLFNGWGGSEPNDNSNNDESNHEEQFVRMTRTQPPFFIDAKGDDNYGALCECDGTSIPASVAATIDGYRR